MSSGSMRRLSRLQLSAYNSVPTRAPPAGHILPQAASYSPRAFPPPPDTRPWQQKRRLADVREVYNEPFAQAWFSSTVPRPTPEATSGPGFGPGSGPDHKPPDERTLKLGKTVRILHERLPTLLVSPLPQEILSPSITLRLFPSTHPHLPAVSGRIAYVAALWTSPVAWGRVPVVGNVKLDIESERMVKNGDEKLIVRWKTCGKKAANGNNANGSVQPADKIAEWFGHLRSNSDDPQKDREFVGLFIFEFDDQGRIASHTIEHADIGENWEAKTSRMISVTDWLLGRAWRKKADEGGGFALGYARLDERRKHARLVAKRRSE